MAKVSSHLEKAKNLYETDQFMYAPYSLLIGEYDAVTELDWVEWSVLDESERDELYSFVKLRGIVDERKKKRA